jgi:hypothetical protein
VGNKCFGDEVAGLPVNDTFLALKIHDSPSQDGYPVGIKIRKDKKSWTRY